MITVQVVRHSLYLHLVLQSSSTIKYGAVPMAFYRRLEYSTDGEAKPILSRYIQSRLKLKIKIEKHGSLTVGQSASHYSQNKAYIQIYSQHIYAYQKLIICAIIYTLSFVFQKYQRILHILFLRFRSLGFLQDCATNLLH